jgi:hypothetical protein
MNNGDKCIFWQDTRPLLDRNGFPAVVIGVSGDGADGERVDVEVSPQHTGRTFNAFGVLVSKKAGPGVVTAEGVEASSQHLEDETQEAAPPQSTEPSKRAAPALAAPKSEGGSGSGRGAVAVDVTTKP